MNDGGPAFPQGVALAPGEVPRASYDFVDGAGMSLRDWFAGQALVGLQANTAYECSWSETAEDCYQLADAMLAERAKERP
jgi:hypothetical protein